MTSGFPSKSANSAETVSSSWWHDGVSWSANCSSEYGHNATLGCFRSYFQLVTMWPGFERKLIAVLLSSWRRRWWWVALTHSVIHNCHDVIMQKRSQGGRVTYICVSKLAIIGSDNGLSPDRRQAIIGTKAGILLIGPLGTNFSEILIEM